ncbi:hypothetical protein [Spirosoma panaciterrae]|uniref:hypothetical protein n=1 Tax=Spirosoma panaciterrae TaxID=496058 RepID=UPI000375F0F7|nr:hypothetical protein [Spirosoma panaciterrae]
MRATASVGQLLSEETYLENVAQQIAIPVASVHLAFRSTVCLMMVCLHQKLQTTIGKRLVYQTLDKQIQQSESYRPEETERSVELLSLEGNSLLGKLLPGKKSPIMTSVIHHTRLPYKQVNQLIGLSAYALITRMASHWQQHNELTSVLLSFKELSQVAPELDEKDYMAIGLHDNLSVFKTVPAYISI